MIFLKKIKFVKKIFKKKKNPISYLKKKKTKNKSKFVGVNCILPYIEIQLNTSHNILISLTCILFAPLNICIISLT